MYLYFIFVSSHVCLVKIEPPFSLCLSHTVFTMYFVVRPTGLWRVDRHFVGICPNSMLALGSQLEGVGGKRLQILQQVGCSWLKAHFFLKGQQDK